MNSLLLLVNLLGLAIMVTLFHAGGGGRVTNRERKGEKDGDLPRESDYVHMHEGTEIRCCVKYNTYFTTEIPIPSTRSEIHHGAIKFNELPARKLSFGETIFFGLSAAYIERPKEKHDFNRIICIVLIFATN